MITFMDNNDKNQLEQSIDELKGDLGEIQKNLPMIVNLLNDTIWSFGYPDTTNGTPNGNKGYMCTDFINCGEESEYLWKDSGSTIVNNMGTIQFWNESGFLSNEGFNVNKKRPESLLAQQNLFTGVNFRKTKLYSLKINL